MAANLETDVDKPARIVADVAKAGDAKELGSMLAAAYLAIGQDGGKFGNFLKQVSADNADDRKANPYLPGFEYAPDSDGNLRADLTTPGKTLGNAWRDKEEVFADIKSGQSILGTAAGVDGQNESAIAEAGSFVKSSGNAQVTALDGATVYAYANSGVTAEKGSKTLAYDNSQVTAEAGSGVSALGKSQVIAQAGSVVVVYGDAQVTAQPGSHVVPADQAQAIIAGHSKLQ
jgi:hypothetical protein